jgi:hypothetical protein
MKRLFVILGSFVALAAGCGGSVNATVHTTAPTPNTSSASPDVFRECEIAVSTTIDDLQSGQGPTAYSEYGGGQENSPYDQGVIENDHISGFTAQGYSAAQSSQFVAYEIAQWCGGQFAPVMPQDANYVPGHFTPPPTS